MAAIKFAATGKYRDIRRLKKVIEKYLKENPMESYSIKTRTTLFDKKGADDELLDTPDGDN